MNRLHVKYLIAGGGIAASSAAEAIRSIDRENTLLMVGQEANRPYNRPPLSKDFLARRGQHDALFTLQANWFAEHRVDLRTGRRVSHLEPGRSAATLDSGQEVSYDQLLIATGAVPKRLKIPGAELPNVFYLRTLDDAHRLGHAIDAAHVAGLPHPDGHGRVAVIGGGLLGVELAATLATLKLGVEWIVGAPLPWPAIAGESAGAVVVEHLTKLGVAVHAGRSAARLDGAGRVQHVTLDNGRTLDCDFAVAAVGSTVNLDLLRGTNIAAETAILADAHCRTTAIDIFAAGDCAAIYDPLFGKYRLIDHWDHARLAGTIAGTNMAGGQAAYDAVSTYKSTVQGLTMTVWGEPKRVYRRVVRRAADASPEQLIEIGIDVEDRVSMALELGRSADTDSLADLVRRRTVVTGRERDLADASVPL